MRYTVTFSGRAAKQAGKLPARALDAVTLLRSDIEADGPLATRWPNFGAIRGRPGCYHCHLKKGRPTYVAVWRVVSEQEVEIRYVGTHEGADYPRLCGD